MPPNQWLMNVVKVANPKIVLWKFVVGNRNIKSQKLYA
jgi:hypothetical protein